SGDAGRARLVRRPQGDPRGYAEPIAPSGHRARAEGNARLRPAQARRRAAAGLALQDRAVADDRRRRRGGHPGGRVPAHRPASGADDDLPLARAARQNEPARRRGRGRRYPPLRSGSAGDLDRLHPAVHLRELIVMSAAVKEALPVDAALPELLEALRTHSAAVLEAPAGAGKTTRVPPALLDRVEGEIVVLEPRRIAARMAARRVAQELGD